MRRRAGELPASCAVARALAARARRRGRQSTCDVAMDLSRRAVRTSIADAARIMEESVSSKEEIRRIWGSEECSMTGVLSTRVVTRYHCWSGGVHMPEKSTGIAVTPGQAQWIVERMVAERRVSAADVRSALAGMGAEIAELERRLAALREARGDAPTAAQAPRSEPAVAKTRKRRGGRRKKGSGHPRGIAGTLAVLLRSIPAAEHAAIQAIRADQGVLSAIRAARIAVRR
jgi:hypothetical protein